jgi:adenine phosphoribosyltransferase
MVNEKSVPDLKKAIRSVPDFPKPGIVFRDITTLLKDPQAFEAALHRFVAHYRGSRIEKVVGIESRGFIFGGALAAQLGAGFVPIRKRGKLPAEVVREEYALEYGADTIEIHRDAISPGERCLLHDDLLATGGTMRAAANLIRKLGGEVVSICFLVELNFLKGREKLQEFDVLSLISYESE